MDFRKKLLVLGTAAVFAAMAPYAIADDDDDHKRKTCEPTILSSAINPEPSDTDVSGLCLDLADATSTKGPPTTKTPKVEAWLDGAFVELGLVPVPGATPSPGGYYVKDVDNVLVRVGVCVTGDDRTGITTLRITRPYLSKGKAKTTTGYGQVAVVFNGGCP